MKLPKLDEAERTALRSPWFWIWTAVGTFWVANAIVGYARGVSAKDIVVSLVVALFFAVIGGAALWSRYDDTRTAIGRREAQAERAAKAAQEKAAAEAEKAAAVARGDRCPDDCAGCVADQRESEESVARLYRAKAARHGHQPVT